MKTWRDCGKRLPGTLIEQGGYQGLQKMDEADKGHPPQGMLNFRKF